MNKLDTLKILLLGSVFVLYCFNLFQTIYWRKTSQYIPNSYKKSVRDVYNELLDVKDFKFLQNARCLICYEGFLVVVSVFSSLGNKDRRKEIRNAWDQADCVQLVFFVGITYNETVMSDIRIESAVHGDIVQGNFMDTYSNLTYKHIMTLKWATYHCDEAKYVIKIDDDVMIDMSLLREQLRLRSWKKTALIACKVLKHAIVVRNKSKWGVPKNKFAGVTYPPYCNGPVIIYSMDVVQRLLEESRRTPHFNIDDAYITGILAKKIGVVPNDTNNLFWIYFDSWAKDKLEKEAIDMLKEAKGMVSLNKWYNLMYKNWSTWVRGKNAAGDKELNFEY